jgi:tRNA dimethylallyltransferase
MKKTGKKIIVILGPTASGKSELGVKLAQKFNGEVVSADSRQVYKKLDIGTGKIIPDTKNSTNFSTGQAKKEIFTHQEIPHHLIDVASPKRTFTIAQYQKLAQKAIKNILKRGKLPIIVGGSGFYIQAITDNIVIPQVPPNKKLRKQLEKKDAAELFKILKKLDPRRARKIDAKNPRRLIRAIEIAKTLGQVPLPRHRNPCTDYDVVRIGIKLTKNKLKKRIKKRLLARIKKGMIKEVKDLRFPKAGKGLSWKRLYNLGLEYRYVAMFLKGELNKKEMTEKLNTAIWQYARRQMTWFSAQGRSASDRKNNKKIHWFSPPRIQQKTEKLIKKFLSSGT